MANEFKDASPFARGFLFAMDWAGKAPRARLEERVPQLAGEDMRALHASFRSLPRESRESMGITWAKRARLERLDERIEVHPSWMAECLENEPAATLLLALGELQPETGREILRSLWPKVRPTNPEESAEEIKPLQPNLAGHLRRHLYSRFVGVSDLEPIDERFSGLLQLDAAEVWLVTQELGRDSESLPGLRRLAEALTDAPRSHAVHIAQKMALPIGTELLQWRDGGTFEFGDVEQSLKIVGETVDLIMGRRRASN